MELIIELLIDFFALKSARRNALKVKKVTNSTNGQISTINCNIENTFKDYITVIFPTGEVNFKEVDKITWDLVNIENTEKEIVFIPEHKSNTNPKKMKLNQTFANEYPSLVLKPNSKIQLAINVNANKSKKKIKFEIAFRMKRLNSKININTIKM